MHQPADLHDEEERGFVVRARWGVGLFILADLVLLSAFLLSQLYLRNLNTEGAFLPAGTHPPPILPGFALVVLAVLAAIAVRQAMVATMAGSSRSSGGWAAIGCTLLIAAVIGQVWQLATLPFGTHGTGSYASSFYLLAGYEVFHLLTAAVVAGLCALRGLRGRGGDRHSVVGVQSSALWVAWVAVAAVAIWATMSFAT